MGFGSFNPFTRSFWQGNEMFSPSNLATGGGRNLIGGSIFTHGGGTFADTYYKPMTLGGKGAVKDADAKAAAEGAAAAAAQIKQTEFEASQKAGLELLALKRKRGFGASMIVGPGSTFGSTSTLGS